jgi:hypothetical protein
MSLALRDCEASWQLTAVASPIVSAHRAVGRWPKVVSLKTKTKQATRVGVGLSFVPVGPPNADLGPLTWLRSRCQQWVVEARGGRSESAKNDRISSRTAAWRLCGWVHARLDRRAIHCEERVFPAANAAGGVCCEFAEQGEAQAGSNRKVLELRVSALPSCVSFSYSTSPGCCWCTVAVRCLRAPRLSCQPIHRPQHLTGALVSRC